MTSLGPERCARYVFGRFRLSADGTLLLRDGSPVPIAPKVLQTLLVLVERAGQVVGKAEILRRVWPDSFVEETGLTRNVSLLRQALGDDGPELIVTVARIGYRFAAPVTVVDLPPASSPRAEAAAPSRDLAAGPQTRAEFQRLVERTREAYRQNLEAYVAAGGERLLGPVPGPDELAGAQPAQADDHRDPRYIRTAHGFGYASCGEVRESGKAPWTEKRGSGDGNRRAVVAPVPERRFRWRRVAIGSVAIALVLAAAAGLWLRSRGTAPAPRLVPLTGTGRALAGSLSPDDRQLAFASTGERGNDWDIWLTVVGGSEARRLTTGPAADLFPAWSPDGKQIAFVRAPGPEPPRWETPGAIYLVSPMGGPERPLADFRTRGQSSWSPDGRWLAVARVREERDTTPESGGIHLIPVGGSEARPLTYPKAPGSDRDPAFSPDGRTLAYASCMEAGSVPLSCNVLVQPLDRAGRPQGPSRRLTTTAFSARGLTWTRDGRSILYAAWGGAHSHIWRVAADGPSAPERVELAGMGGIAPVAGRSHDRLIFTRVRLDLQIRRLQLGGTDTPFIQSTMVDFSPQYSPDGRRVAFISQRAEERGEIWLADADGTNVTRLTRGPGQTQGRPHWSPDGRTIAFESGADHDGHFDIWTIGVDGSRLRRITRDPGDEYLPSFSRDGRFLYYCSSRTGRHEIWRVPVAGGADEQVTHEGGVLAFEAADGHTLYYLRNWRMGDNTLLARPTRGGPERIVAPCVPTFGYAVGPQGVLHLGCQAGDRPTSSRRSVWLRDAATGRDREVATLDLPPGASFQGMGASPDGSTLLYSTGAWTSTVMMMIDNFR